MAFNHFTAYPTLKTMNSALYTLIPFYTSGILFETSNQVISNLLYGTSSQNLQLRL